MLHHNLTTAQTTPSGLPVHKLYIYKAVTITHEYYFAITFDRSLNTPILLISDTGGVNIESSNNLHKLHFHLNTGITPEIDAYIQAELGFSDSEMEDIKAMVCDMVRLFREKDATLLELNPLVRTEEGFVCLDAKFEFDNSARFRQKGIFAQGAEEGQEETRRAEELGLSYVRLEGNIGNIVNGAGLAMATNDLITLVGGRCANFLDVGGGATKDGLKEAFGILKNDERVKGVLINIYGGEFDWGWNWIR
jgi:succinyl-CoA synthetase beta subunit